MPKKILIHSLVFSPDGVSTAYLYNDIALRFQQAGYDVRVLTTSPHFNMVEEQIREQPLHWGVWGIYRVSSYHGIKVYHVPQHKFKRTVFRILGFVYWHIISFFIALFMRHVDVILSPSPPLSLGVLNLILKRLKGCRVIYNVQEIYPDIMHLNDGWVLRMLKWAEQLVYNKSDAVTTIDQVFHDNIVGRFRQPEHLHIIPNFVDTSLYHADIKWQGVLDEAIFPQTDNLKLLYAGNIGKAQAWQPLIDLAVRTKDLPVEFFVIGKGALRDELQQQIEEKQLTKIHLLPYQPRQLMPAILSYSDIQFIFMDPQMEMQGFPSKVYTIMACGKPLLVSSGQGTPIINFLQPLDCAKLITEHDPQIKVDQMAEWLSNVSREELQTMGQRGISVIQQIYSKEVVTAQYVSLVDNMLKQ